MEETEGRGRLCSVTAREPPGRLDSNRLLNSRRAPSQFRSGTSCGGDGGGGATFRRPSQDDLREKKGGRGQKDKRQMTALIILTSVLLRGKIQTETDPSLSFFRLLHFSGRNGLKHSGNQPFVMSKRALAVQRHLHAVCCHMWTQGGSNKVSISSGRLSVSVAGCKQRAICAVCWSSWGDLPREGAALDD